MRTFDGAPPPPAIDPEELVSLRALVQKRYETAGDPGSIVIVSEPEGHGGIRDLIAAGILVSFMAGLFFGFLMAVTF